MKVVSLNAASIVLMIAVMMNGTVSGDVIDDSAPEVNRVADESHDAPIPVEEAAEVNGLKAPDLNALIVPLLSLFGFEVEGMADEQDVAEEGVNFEAMVQESAHELRPLMMVELEFVRLVCGDLNPDQRTKIRIAAKTSLQEVATQMVKQQRRDERGLANATPNVDPARTIRQTISDALKENLTEEQMARFTDESAQRMSHRKKASILSFISHLDGQLFLTMKQREQIESDLSSHWQDGWESWLMMVGSFDNQYFPSVPDKCVISHLNAEQKKIWEAMPKLDCSSWDGDIGENPNNDGWWGEEPDGDNLAPNGGVPIILMKKVGVEFDVEGVKIFTEVKADDESRPFKVVP